MTIYFGSTSALNHQAWSSSMIAMDIRHSIAHAIYVSGNTGPVLTRYTTPSLYLHILYGPFMVRFGTGCGIMHDSEPGTARSTAAMPSDRTARDLPFKLELSCRHRAWKVSPMLRPHRTQLLRPRLVRDAIPRPRLLDLLAAGLERPLTLIVAPAGYGKTTLLCQWLDTIPARVAWFSLHQHDSDLTTFLTNFLGALQTLWPKLGRDLLDMLNLPATPSPDYLGAALADALLDVPEPTFLALDDYQVIADPAIHAFLTALLEHPAPEFHLAIASRRELPLPLPLLRTRDQIAEVRGQDLAFTPAEAQAFLTQAAGADVSAELAARFEQQIEGWATGLRLAAFSVREEGTTAWRARGLTQRRQQHALDFLLDEVLARLPAATQAFLV